MIVFVVTHLHDLGDDREDMKLIGVYSTEERAREAVARLSLLPGFRETTDGFSVDLSVVDQDGWVEGFVTVRPGAE